MFACETKTIGRTVNLMYQFGVYQYLIYVGGHRIKGERTAHFFDNGTSKTLNSRYQQVLPHPHSNQQTEGQTRCRRL